MSAEDKGQSAGNLVIDHLDLWSGVYTKKVSTGRGSSGKVSPYGVQKLRELILELAVRGKLVEQNPNDEPGSVLLENAIAQKAALVKAKVMRKTKVPAAYAAETEAQIPPSWIWTTLHELGEIGPRNILEDDVEAAFVPMEQISDQYGVPVGQEVRPWGEVKKGFTHFAENDVALAKITPCFQNGKSAVMRGLQSGVGAGTTELHIFRPIEGTVVPDFALLFLKSPGFILDGIPRMTGTAGQKRITRDYFAGKPFPLPPLAEQHRIVAKVDELMALCDQLEQQQTDSLQAHQTLVETLLRALVEAGGAASTQQAWNHIAEHFDTLFTTEESIDQLKQTILQLAVMGRLVPQDPREEPAGVLLEKIADERVSLVEDGLLKKQKKLLDVAEKEKLFEIPEAWEWVRFGSLIKSFANGLYKKASFYGDEGLISLRMYNIQNGGVDFADARRVSVSDDEQDKYRLEEGDLLINRVNSKELVGKAALIPDYPEPLLFESMNMRAKPFTSHVCSEYLNLYLKTEMAKLVLRSHAKEAISQASLNQGQISSLPMPLPSKEEQHRIVAKVDELMALCDTLKAQIQQAQTTQVHLADAIVEQAIA